MKRRQLIEALEVLSYQLETHHVILENMHKAFSERTSTERVIPLDPDYGRVYALLDCGHQVKLLPATWNAKLGTVITCSECHELTAVAALGYSQVDVDDEAEPVKHKPAASLYEDNYYRATCECGWRSLSYLSSYQADTELNAHLKANT